MRSLVLCVIVLLLCTGNCRAQVLRDTLQNVIKTAPARKGKTEKISIRYGLKGLTVDSSVLSDYKSQTIATLLAQQVPVFIRTYGTNGLATLSLRGASAAQTAVRWNGVPLQSGATGLVDLMLIPASVVDEVVIEYGSNGGRIGSGAVGGTLFLENKDAAYKPSHDYSVFGSIGSFGRLQGGLRLKQATTKWEASVVATTQKATNDFQHTDNLNRQRKLDNGAATSGNLQANLARKLSRNNSLNARLWYSTATREIPPALFESLSIKEQKDAALRAIVSYNHTDTGQSYGVDVSWFDEWFKYRDSTQQLNTSVHSQQWYVNPYYTKEIHKYAWLTISLPQQWNYIIGSPEKKVLKSALTAQLKGARFRKWSYLASGRAEFINGKLYAAGGANADIKVIPAVTVRGSVGYAYRAPTLNELYYTPGGNPDLLPEQGWSTEAGYTWEPGISSSFKLTHSTTGFYRDMKNWILWFGGSIWTPHNIARVASKGIETENKLVWSRPRASWQLSANASYISSTTMESLIPGDGSAGCQIPYAPRVIGQGGIGFNTAAFRIRYNHTYTGLRYFNTDETGEIPAFNTGNIVAGYLLNQKNWSFDLSLQVQNVWNNHYQEVAFRPAPGVNWLLGVVVREAR